MTFTSRQAVRSRVPLTIALVGPSGGGKTMSALELATGFGGKTFFIDSEARRSEFYADHYDFQIVEFDAPFSPARYQEAIEYCVSQGADTVVVDSMSHEHEGPGGVLEMHREEQKSLAKRWGTSEDKVKMTAWQKPKSERVRCIQTVLRLGCNVILCFRAKEKLDLTSSKPVNLGWQPIAGPEYVYECVTSIFLPPNANGVPSWRPERIGERQMVKLPRQFRGILDTGKALSVEMGKQLATWAAGTPESEPLWTFPSGEHAGQSLEQVPSDYLESLINRGHSMSSRFDAELVRRRDTQ